METNNEARSVAKLLADIEVILEAAIQEAVEKLRPYTQRQLEPDEIFACFELWNLQNYGLNYNKFFARQNDQGRINLDPDYEPVTEDASFIPELDKYMEDVFGNQEFELTQAEDEEFSAEHEQQLFKWFAECWWAAGGESSAVPTFFCFEKEGVCRDLKTAEVLSEVEAARRLGYEVEV